MYIPITEKEYDFSSEGFVVRFYREDGTSWVANFERGWSAFDLVHAFPGQPDLLVVAGGKCYVMNPELTVPRDIFGIYFQGGLPLPDGRLMLYDVTEVTLVESNCQYRYLERVSWDGIADVRLEGDFVTGLGYQPSHYSDAWKPIKVDINSLAVTGQSYPIGKEIKKPWWRFW